MNNNKEKENNKKNSTPQKRLFPSGDPKLDNYLNKKYKNDKDNTDNNNSNDNEIFDTINPNDVYKSPLLMEIQRKAIHEIDSSIVSKLKNESDLKDHVRILINSICDKEYPTLSNKERMMIIKSLINEFTGFGPIQKLLEDESVSEIMINGPKQIYVEKKGVVKPTDIRFRDNEHVIQIIDKIVSRIGRRIDESSPMVDARLPDGSRINAVIPPVSLIGPILTIRKFSKIPFTIDKLVLNDTLNSDMAKFLEMAILAKANIIVAGGTGSGKTTFLNVLSSLIPESDRIITIEDAAELKLQQPHILSLESRQPNIESKGEITIRDLVRNSLRMRPDRIVIGEVRGAEALDMLQAMNTGHEGSLSTIHANSARDAISRLETMVLYSGIDFPLRAIREQIHSAIDIIVFIQRLHDGSRKVTNVSEVTGMEGDMIVLQDIFYFEQLGKSNGKVHGEFKRYSVRPKITDKFKSLGIKSQRW